LTNFASLGLSSALLKAVEAEGYSTPTPIQAKAIPSLLEGRDLLGIAQTGTGKTAAFALPMLERLSKDNRKPEPRSARALILTPTRELSAQIQESFRVYGKNVRLKSLVVFGGVGIGRQIENLKHGVDVLVATPGRLVDLIERKALTLSKVEIFVLDEVDQMLDLGFIHAIRKITAMLPKERQNLFFSATMPKEIAGLAANLLRDPVRVEITPVATTAERVTQAVIHVDPANKVKLLVELLSDPQITRALIFTRTKHGADKVVKALAHQNYQAAAIHGNKSQANREKALAGFKNGKILALVATDIAARGIDVDGVSHVFNYDLPFVPESYVHRIGRTARAGATGEAIAFCTPEDRGLLRDIEKTIRQPVPVKEHALGLKVSELAPTHGWNPVREKRSSGGGRHMPKGPKKPHHRGHGQRPSHEPNLGRRAEGDSGARVEARHAPRPTQQQPMHANTPERRDRPETQTAHTAPVGKRPPRFGDKQAHHARNDGDGKRTGFAAPKKSAGNSAGNSGSWMRQLGGE